MQLYDITNDMSDWDKHWYAFTNVIQIYQSYSSNTLSQRVRDQIGEESLSEIASTIVKKVKAFFKWLWEKIKTIFGKIKAFFVAIYKKIKKILFGSTSATNGSNHLNSAVLDQLFRKDVNLPSRYHYRNITEILREYKHDYYPVFNYNVNMDHLQFVNDELQKEHRWIEKVLQPLPNDEEFPASTIAKCLEDVYSWVSGMPNDFMVIGRVIDAIKKYIKEFESADLSEENIAEKLRHIFELIVKQMLNCMPKVQWYNKYVISSNDDLDKYKDNLITIKSGFEIILRIAHSGTYVYGKVSRWMCNRYREYNADGRAMNKKISVPDFLRKHLEEHYGEKIDVGYIYLTTLMPSTWKHLIGRNGCGWTGGESEDSGHSENIWINLHVFLKDSKGIREGFKHIGDAYDNANSGFISMIVHEFKHNSDYQHGRGDMMEGSNSSTDHDERWEEKRAIDAERTFKPTQQELEWASKVLEEAEREYYKKQGNN